MQQQWYNPVVILKPGLQRLMGHITDRMSEDMQQVILSLGINFLYDDRPLPLQTPVADLATNRIIIQDVYMSFLWCCSYATVAFNKMYYAKAQLDQDIVRFSDEKELPKIDLTLRWARSLVNEVTYWPEDAARPDKPDPYTDDAGNLFQACIAYILFHEIGHLVLHSGLKDTLVAKNGNPYYEITVDDQKRMYEAELEADAFALRTLIGDSTLNNVLLTKHLGAALAQLSNFYLREIPDTRGGKTHPDLDDRLRAVLAEASLNTEADQIQLQAHISVGLQLFLHLTGKQFIPEDHSAANFKDFKQLEEYLFALIAEMKAAARNRPNY